MKEATLGTGFDGSENQTHPQTTVIISAVTVLLLLEKRLHRPS